ncbi:MAG: glycoside hydrolase family 2 [Oscillospiraceae bacterium]|jgi:hypothetical protein|nr:glycoside hydrolase family 2 [Oscillospiraceae bacterium]
MERLRRTLTHGWRFALGEHEFAWRKGFDDTKWSKVSIPHDWSIEQPFSEEHSSCAGYLPGGIGYYRCRFPLENTLQGKRIDIQFDGVYRSSSVWLNGYHLGGRPSGYAPFRFDITDIACFDESGNELVVRVDHQETRDSRWYTGSGIYRKVTLTARDTISIMPDGIFIITKQADAAGAKLLARTWLENASDAYAHIRLIQSLIDAQGSEVARAETSAEIIPHKITRFNQTLSVENPNLWSTDNPALYRCVTRVLEGGDERDSVETRIGIRTARFSSREGFLLNSVPVKIKGVCIHHDAGCLGAAVRANVWRRRLSALRALGCNAIRTCHNPHMPELYDLCDEIGFLVMNEAFDEWENPKKKWWRGYNKNPPAFYGYSADFPDWHERDLTAFVKRDRNHPSVILWSIGNELDFPNDPYNHPFIRQMQGNGLVARHKEGEAAELGMPSAARLTGIAKKLKAIVRRSDPSRPVTAAIAFPELARRIGYTDQLDVLGYNYREDIFEKDHQQYPKQPIFASESRKDAREWKAAQRHRFIAGQFLWAGIDFLGEARGWPIRGSSAGLLDMAAFPKPFAYHRAALWLDTPVTKLYVRRSASERPSLYDVWSEAWAFPEGTALDVICLSNAVSAELFIGEASQGVRAIADGSSANTHLADSRDLPHADDSCFLWRVTYQPLPLTLRARYADGSAATHALESPGTACDIRLESDVDSLLADGQDVAHITARIVDANGRRVPQAENILRVSVRNGTLLGLENGAIDDIQPYSQPFRRAKHGRLLIYVGAPSTPQRVNVVVSSDLFGVKTIELEARADV